MSSFGFVSRNQFLADPDVSFTAHSHLNWIYPLPWMFDQESFQPNLHTNSILLRRYPVDLPSELSEVKSSIFAESAVK